jgi:cytochrome c-type biogenesis protein CcmH/NrfG
LFRIAAHNVPGEARYHLALGRARARDPRTAREAIEALETAARLAPNDPQVRRLLAEIGARPEGEEASGKSGGLLDRLRRKP